jgi:ABC-2 type transport system permease protein
MIAVLRRRVKVYGAFAAMVPKLYLAYQIWVWMEFVVQVISLIIFVAFWQAVYAGGDAIGGLTLDQTLNYIILARIFTPVISASNTLFNFGYLMREGQIGIELLRPVDFQLTHYVSNVSEVFVGLVSHIPLAIVGWLLFRYQVPADPLIWLAFLLSLLLGNALLFCFDWMLGCIAFYSTEVWGLGVLRSGIATFFSGSLVPLAMMPRWLRTVAMALPFSQALYTPVALLSGVTPLAEMPRTWLTQLAVLVALVFLSRTVFNVAVRKVTVQGG